MAWSNRQDHEQAHEAHETGSPSGGGDAGLVEAGTEFYTVSGAFAARETLDSFESVRRRRGSSLSGKLRWSPIT